MENAECNVLWKNNHHQNFTYITINIYIGTCYIMPHKYIKDLNKIIYSFLWNSKREKVKRAVVINPPLQGELGMVDVHILAHCTQPMATAGRCHFVTVY